MKANRKVLFVNKSAVSPVLGVMLMIVVTVILAAAVAAFSNGIGSKDEPTSAVFDVEKLRWMNQKYIKEKTEEELLDLLGPFLSDEAKKDGTDRILKIIK